MLEKIIEENKQYLSGDYTKVLSEPTHEVYIFDNKYILKIYVDDEITADAITEINFYRNNKENEYIPEIFSCNDVANPFYIIIEKLDGISLFNLWYKLNNSDREKIIYLLVDFLKKIHKNKRESNNWEELIVGKALHVIDKIRRLELLNESELEIVEQAISSSKKYLVSESLSMIHGDFTFNNIFITPDNDIKVIDFEKASYAPIDFELDAILRMCREPKRYADEYAHTYIDMSDYQMIPLWIERYYPEIFDIKNLDKRLLFYDLYYNLNYLTGHINSNETKEKIIYLANKINKD